jgi:hypothetical protein
MKIIDTITIKLRDVSEIKLVFMLLPVALMYFLPALSHIIGYPLYFLEPMRLVILFSMVLLEKKEALILAVTLPLFAFVTTGHPTFPKLFIVSAELLFFVYLFFIVNKKISIPPISLLIAILLSKSAYYLMKYILIMSFLGNSELISTPIQVQIFTAIGYSAFLLIPKIRDRI